MNQSTTLADRFGAEAALRIEPLLARLPAGDGAFAPAPPDRCRGALAGTLFGEAMPALLRGARTGPGPNTQMALIAGEAALKNPATHPESLAAALVAANIEGAGRATECARDALRRGACWSQAGAPNSAGSAAAARAAVFGLLYAGDPARAAYEAALSATVTHRHGAAVAAAAAVAGAVALAARSDEPLGRDWLESVARICDRFPQESVYGQTVAGAIRAAGQSLAGDPWPSIRSVGRSALCTQAVPAALLTAACAPAPLGSARPDRADLVLGALDSLHEASRAIAGTCIGARGGRDAWISPGGLIASGRRNLVRTRSLADVLAVADRIAAYSGPSVSLAPPPAEAGPGDPGVHVSFLIDRSGSMSGLEDDVVGGFNNFVAEQRSHAGDCRLTLVMFDSQDPGQVLLDDIPLEDVPDMGREHFQPRGATPLLDALGDLIEAADGRRGRPGRNPAGEDQVVVVFTDGQENCSQRWSRRRLFELIAARREAGWSFVFLGANQDSYAEAGSLGIGDGSIQDYRGDHSGVRTAFGSVNRALAQYRHAGREERERQRSDFFGGRKEAEEDHHGRTD